MPTQGVALRRRTVGWFLSCILYALISAFVSVAQAPRFTVGPQAAAGRKLFAQSCASCHEVDSRNQFVGPGLRGYYTEQHPSPDDAAVRELIIRGKGTMPGFTSFTDTELAELTAYLKTL
jgi:mono/diheme cytochrome c family protein